VCVCQKSPLTKQKSSLQHKKASDSPLPHGASFSSNELDDDHLENPTNELSPMKSTHTSGMRLPKQTKLMFQNMEVMRQDDNLMSPHSVTESGKDVTEHKGHAPSLSAQDLFNFSKSDQALRARQNLQAAETEKQQDRSKEPVGKKNATEFPRQSKIDVNIQARQRAFLAASQAMTAESAEVFSARAE